MDANVLIGAAQGTPAVYEQAMEILDDPEREFVSSKFLRLEVEPKPTRNKQMEELSFYKAFFEEVACWVEVTEEMLDKTYDMACLHGMSAIDAFHVMAAIESNCDVMVTAEKNTKPMFQVSEINVITIRE